MVSAREVVASPDTEAAVRTPVVAPGDATRFEIVVLIFMRRLPRVNYYYIYQQFNQQHACAIIT